MGTWVGPGTYAARGVPERFLDPTKPRTVEKAAVVSNGDGEAKKGDGHDQVTQQVAPGQEQQKEGVVVTPSSGPETTTTTTTTTTPPVTGQTQAQPPAQPAPAPHFPAPALNPAAAPVADPATVPAAVPTAGTAVAQAQVTQPMVP